jgi:diguanylate cyclase (GGDEF)-like protein/PAS domain S-box-containing protein
LDHPDLIDKPAGQAENQNTQQPSAPTVTTGPQPNWGWAVDHLAQGLLWLHPATLAVEQTNRQADLWLGRGNPHHPPKSLAQLLADLSLAQIRDRIPLVDERLAPRFVLETRVHPVQQPPFPALLTLLVSPCGRVLVEIRDISHERQLHDKLFTYQTQLEELVRQRAASLIKSNNKLQLMGRVFETALESILITDHQGIILRVNPAFTDMSGYSAAEVVGKQPNVLKSGHHDADFYRNMWQGLREQGRWTGEIWNRRKNGEAYPQHLSISAIYGKGRKVTHYVAVAHDISEWKRKEKEISSTASHDALTGLPNRKLFLDRLHQALRRAKRQHIQLALIFLDFDDFKRINDGLGHQIGDQMLIQFGSRVKAALREQDVVGRWGGDEFVVLLDPIEGHASILTAVERIRNKLSVPFEIEGKVLRLSTSMGISVYPEDGTSDQELVQHADLAMYQAKKRNKGGYHFFTPALQAQIQKKQELAKRLCADLKEGRLKSVYQGRFDLSTRDLIGLEALGRWHATDGSIRNPESFLNIAEEHNLLSAIDRNMVIQVLQDLQQFRTQTPFQGFVSVNLSVRSLMDEPFTQWLLERWKESTLPEGSLRLEIPEYELSLSVERLKPILERLSAAGMPVIMDHFGNGFFPLAQMASLPIAQLNLEKSLIQRLEVRPDIISVVNAYLSLAKALGLTATATGIETPGQFERLQQIECRQGQGEFLGCALTKEETLLFLTGHRELSPVQPERKNALPESSVPEMSVSGIQDSVVPETDE